MNSNPNYKEIAERLIDRLRTHEPESSECRSAQLLDEALGNTIGNDIMAILQESKGSGNVVVHYICHLLIIVYQLGYEERKSQESLKELERLYLKS